MPRQGRVPTIALVVAGFMLFGSVFALIIPPLSGADEYPQAVRAWSVYHGHAVNSAVIGPDGKQADTILAGPKWLDANWTCSGGNPAKTAAQCPAIDWDTKHLHRFPNNFASYSPLYYGVAGIPFAFGDGEAHFYAARLITVALGALVIGFALVALRPVAPQFAALAAVAITPTSTALLGTISPSGLEITLAFLVTALLWRLRADGYSSTRGWRAGFAAATLALVLVRPSGLVWLTGIALGYLLLGMTLDRRRFPWFLPRFEALWTAGAVVVGLAWIVAIPPFQPIMVPAPWLTPLRAVWLSIAETGDRLTQAVAISGALDATIPSIFAMVGIGTWLLVVGYAWQRVRRGRLALISLTLFAVVVPWLLEAVQATRWLGWWQGRYQLPAIAALIATALLLAGWRRSGRIALVTIWSLLSLGLVIATVARQTTGLQVLNLFTRGTGGHWSPPLPTWVLLGGATVAAVLWIAAAAAGGDARPATGQAVSTPPGR